MDTLVGQAANEFLEELERGGRPRIEDYIRRYPDIASVLGEVLGALEAMRPSRSGPNEAAAASVETEVGLGRLGDFHILREIGRGGMGVVYKAEQLSLGRRVALKVLPAAAAMDAKRLQRFRNEAQAAAHLHHQNIVPVHAVGKFGSTHYYAMQYIEGQTLAALIRELRRMNAKESPTGLPSRTRRFASPAGDRSAGGAEWLPADGRPANRDVTVDWSGDPEAYATLEPSSAPSSSVFSSDSSAHSRAFFRTAARLGAQAADALEHAHSMGIVHRDIKPSNILLDLRGNLWITDFGLAHIHGDTQLTTTGDLVGTLRYMSPEQALSRRGLLDQRTDVYSLGITLYELATLEPAFNTDDRQELLRRIAFEDPRPPRKLNRSIPRDLETIILKAISKDPGARYTTAQEMGDDLRRFLNDEPIQARRPTPVQKAAKWCRRHRAVVSTAVVVALVGLVATTLVAALGAAREKKHREEAERKLELAWGAFDDMYLRGHKLLQYEPHMTEVQKTLLDKALSFYQEFLLEPAPGHDGAFKRAQALNRIAEIRYAQGSPGEDVYYAEGPQQARATAAARKLLQESVEAAGQAVEQLRILVEQSPDVAAYGSELAQAYVTHGKTLWLLGDAPSRKQAEAAYRSAASCFEKLCGIFPERKDFRAQQAACESAIASLLPAPRSAERDAALSHARDILQDLVKHDSKNVEWKNALASVYRQRGEMLVRLRRSKEAEPVLRTAATMLDELSVGFKLLPESNYDVQQTYLSLGEIYSEAGKAKEAEQSYERARDAGEKLLAVNPKVPRFHAGLAAALNGLAVFRYARQDLKGARDLEEKAVRHLQIAHEAVRDNFNYRYSIQRCSALLGQALLQLGEYRLAAERARWVADIIPGCPLGARDAAMLYCGCVDATSADKHLSPAERQKLAKAYARDVPHLLDRMIQNSGFFAGSFSSLPNDAAWLLATFPDEHVRNPARALKVAERVVLGNGKTECKEAAWWNTLGVARYRVGDWKGAVAALEHAIKLNRGTDPSDKLFLAMAYRQLGKYEQPQCFYDQALEQMKAMPISPELRRFRAEAEMVLGKRQTGPLPPERGS